MKTGWWTLNTTIEINDADREHIAECIKGGFTSGQIVQEDEDEDEKEDDIA